MGGSVGCTCSSPPFNAVMCQAPWHSSYCKQKLRWMLPFSTAICQASEDSPAVAAALLAVPTWEVRGRFESKRATLRHPTYLLPHICLSFVSVSNQHCSRCTTPVPSSLRLSNPFSYWLHQSATAYNLCLKASVPVQRSAWCGRTTSKQCCWSLSSSGAN
jgi:hypothetical protein